MGESVIFESVLSYLCVCYLTESACSSRPSDLDDVGVDYHLGHLIAAARDDVVVEPGDEGGAVIAPRHPTLTEHA